VPKRGAGLLLYPVRDGVVEVLIGYSGGPFWARRDDGAWSILKASASTATTPGRDGVAQGLWDTA
jgi:predicted NUDIX family NTP pyrophosphohydrolase